MNVSSLPIKQIDIADFNYDLPDELIARHPLARRDSCRLLVAIPSREGTDSDALARVLPDEPSISHHRFDEILSLLPENTLLVRNNTKVINARLRFHKQTGAAIEIFLLEPLAPADYAQNFQTSAGSCSWKCLVGNLKKWKEGPLSAVVTLPDGREVNITAERGPELPGKAHEIRFSWTEPVAFGEIISALGNIPIPPYLNRESEESDLTDYQTVYAEAQGSVAAPTAGLHFTDELFDKIANSGRQIDVADVTLHVGAGTFRPVKSETLGGHDMHSETFSISRELVEQLIEAVESDRLVAAVGTTTVRTLESLPYIGMKLMAHHDSHDSVETEIDLHVDQWEPYADPDRVIPTGEALRAILTEMNLRNTDSLTASTSILIGPAFNWQVVEAMVTNFHQPESTLLLLVSSFLGMTPEHVSDHDALWRRIYREAVREKYRFLSYGDACLFFRHAPGSARLLRLPGSKSVSNRVLVLNSLSDPSGELVNLSDSTDTAKLRSFIELLKLKTAEDRPFDFYIGEGATPLRFAAALAMITPKVKVRIFPSRRLVERLEARNTVLFDGTFFSLPMIPVPVDQIDLPEADLKKLKIRKSKKGAMAYGYFITDEILSYTEEVESIEIDASKTPHTSQELSALLLVSSMLPAMKIVNLMAVPSLPYLLMTYRICQDFGARVEMEWKEDQEMAHAIVTHPCELRAPEVYSVEPDWSALLNFYAFAVAARCGLNEEVILNVEGCPDADRALQPDSRQSRLFDEILAVSPLPEAERLKKRIDKSFVYTPDALPPFVAAALCAGVPFTARHLDNLTAKESDRVEVLKTEFGKLGWKLTKRTGAAGLSLSSKGAPRREVEENPLLDSHDDHRIAMALAATLPVTRRFRLKNPYCVVKSMPDFWKELAHFGVRFRYDAKTDTAQLEYKC